MNPETLAPGSAARAGTAPIRRLHVGGKVRKEGWEVLNALPGPSVDHSDAIPQRSMATPKIHGASAVATRAGSVIQPWRAP